jgi:hypothetical protein
LNRYLSRTAALVGSAAVVVSSLLVTATAAQAAGDGTLVVTVVDQYGRPTPGLVEAYATDGTQYSEPAPVVGGSTHTFTVPEGGYSVLGITPWSGFTCDGAAPCTFLTSPSSFTPVVAVVAGGLSTYTSHVTVPSISGNSAIGSPLSINIPAGLTSLQTILGVLAPGLSGAGTQQWVRGATDIPGATGLSYTTVVADGSQALAARLAPSVGQSLIFASMGLPVNPLTTNAITVAKLVPAKTKTKVQAPKSVAANAAVTLKVKVKSKSGKPDGSVTIKVGHYRAKKALKDGSVFITLPRLSSGTYTISVSYGGSETFKKSKANTKLTVRP